jgi:hypothetical protein
MLRNSALCVKESAYKILRKQEFAGYGTREEENFLSDEAGCGKLGE